MSDRFFEVDGGGHHPAERMAQFADGVLTNAARAEVERHLAECADCREVLVDTMAFLATESDAALPEARADTAVRFHRRGLFAFGGALAAAAAGLMVMGVATPYWWRGWLGGRQVRPELEELVAAVAEQPTRLLEGRLTGFPYAPPPSPTRGPESREASPDVRIAAARIEKVAIERDTSENRAALSMAHVALGDLDAAITDLERALEPAPDRASDQSDLSALYLARARRGSGGDDLRKALAAAERALAIEPELEEACFNRALVLEGVGTRSQAQAAWESCLRSSTESGWTAEIRRHLER